MSNGQQQPQKPKTAINPTREVNYQDWYQEVIKAADLAENSDVRGCMVIKPWGYALWENIQHALDDMFKETGHQNAYFPLFIPVSFLEKEAAHVEGFAKECAVVTHHRLELKDGKLIPTGELEEPLVVRPTSETIIGASFAKWVQSYRDLPLLINQWANVVRWEMRTRLFLRTAEFLWQEGHTAHATDTEAVEETMRMLDVYAEFSEKFMAVPVIKGQKTAAERFPGAVDTYCIEAMMQDKKALQCGTSHFLGQNFSKASGIQFTDQNNQPTFAWTTSWGVSTRLIGGMIMTHADDDGMVCPPRLAPRQIVIVAIARKPEDRPRVIEYCTALAKELRALRYNDEKVRVELDVKEGGGRHWGWIKKGVPVILEVGLRDIESGTVSVARRDRAGKANIAHGEFVSTLPMLLQDIQDSLFARAKAFQEANTKTIDTKDEFYAFFADPPKKKPNDPTPIHGGFALTHYNGDPALEEKIKNDLKVTVRCIPLSGGEPGVCAFTGEPSKQRVVWAKSY
jgi:prolyl-tRNA synthetase